MNARQFFEILSSGDLDAYHQVLVEDLPVGEMTGNERVATTLTGRKFHGGALGWDVLGHSHGYIGLLGDQNRDARTFGAALGLVPEEVRRPFFEVSLEVGLFGEDLALCYAAEIGDFNCLEWLLDSGVDPDADVSDEDRSRRTKFGFRPLHLAALAGHLDVVHRLVEGGVPVDQKAAFSDSAVRIYVSDPSPLLLLTSQLVYSKPLSESQWEVAEELLNLGADPLYETKGKPSSPLDAALRSGNQRLYDLLGELGGVDINDHPFRKVDEHSPLRELVGRVGTGRAIAWALEAGWQFRDDERDGRSAAHAFKCLVGSEVCFAKSATLPDEELRRLATELIEVGNADPRARGFTGIPIFVNLCHAPALVDLLIEYGVDPNELSECGESAVYCLVKVAVDRSKQRPQGTFGQIPDVPRWLSAVLEAGAEPEVHECEGNVLEMALKTADGRIVELLVDYGADPSKLSPYQQLRVYAAIGDSDAASDLLEEGVESCVGQGAGFGPYVLAAMGGHREVVELLLEHGLELHRKELSSYLFKANVGELSVEIFDLLVEALSSEVSEFFGHVIRRAIGADRKDLTMRLLNGNYESTPRELESALSEAARKGEREVMEALLDQGHMPEIDEGYAVPGAIENDEVEILKILLDRGGSLPEGEKPAWCVVADNCSAEVAEYLASHELGDPLATRARDGMSPLEIVDAKLPRFDELAEPEKYGDEAEALKQKCLRVARALRQLGAGDVDRAEQIAEAMTSWRQAMETYRRDWPEWRDLEAVFDETEELEWAMADGVEYLYHPDRRLAVPVPTSLSFGPDELLYDWFFPLSGADNSATTVSGSLLSHGGRYGVMHNPREFYPEIAASALVPAGGLYVLQHNRSGTPVFADREDQVRIFDASTGEFEVVGSVESFIRYCLAQLLQGRHWATDGYARKHDLDTYQLRHVPFVE